jgi:hypothetical protein
MIDAIRSAALSVCNFHAGEVQHGTCRRHEPATESGSLAQEYPAWATDGFGKPPPLARDDLMVSSGLF